MSRTSQGLAPSPGKGEAQREKIIREAIRLFSLEGFTETSIRKIADGCDLTQSTVLYHFQSKENLIEKVVDLIAAHNIELVSALMLPEDSAEQRLEKYFIGNLMWGSRFRDEAQILILLYYMACFNPRFKEYYARTLKRARDRIREQLLSGIREGVFHLTSEPELIAEALHDALVGSLINLVTGAATDDEVEKIRVKCRLFIRSLTR